MSAFGYGSTYMPSWREGSAAQQSPLSQQSQFSIAPAMSAPNWQPSVTTPWATPGVDPADGYNPEDWSAYKGDFGMNQVGGVQRYSNDWLGNHSSSTGNLYSRDPWANPLDNLWQQTMGNNGIGGNVDPSQLGKQNAVGGSFDNRVANANVTALTGFGENGDSYQLGAGKYDFTQNTSGGKGGSAQTYAQPTNTRDLYNSVGGLSLDQLMRMSGNQGGLQQSFSNTAQAYKNAYANPYYGQQLSMQQTGNAGVNPLSEGQTMDYLQQSYDKISGRMNDNYLL